MDEAEKKGISVDFSVLSESLGIPAVGICARKKKGIQNLLHTLDKVLAAAPENKSDFHTTSLTKCRCEADITAADAVNTAKA